MSTITTKIASLERLRDGAKTEGEKEASQLAIDRLKKSLALIGPDSTGPEPQEPAFYNTSFTKRFALYGSDKSRWSTEEGTGFEDDYSLTSTLGDLIKNRKTRKLC